MNIDLPASIEFGDEDGFVDFLASNELNHQQQQEAMLKAGLTPEYAPLYTDPRINKDWLGTHYFIHRNQFEQLGLGADNVPALSECDFEDPEQFATWMADHAWAHDIVNQVLGLGT